MMHVDEKSPIGYYITLSSSCFFYLYLCIVCRE